MKDYFLSNRVTYVVVFCISAKQNMITKEINLRKHLFIFILLFVKFSFVVEECEGQFQWGTNYRLEALKLKEMLLQIRLKSQCSATCSAF